MSERSCEYSRGRFGSATQSLRQSNPPFALQHQGSQVLMGESQVRFDGSRQALQLRAAICSGFWKNQIQSGVHRSFNRADLPPSSSRRLAICRREFLSCPSLNSIKAARSTRQWEEPLLHGFAVARGCGRFSWSIELLDHARHLA